MTDISDFHREFTVDEVLAQQDAAGGPVPDEPGITGTETAEPPVSSAESRTADAPQSVGEMIEASFLSIARSHAACAIEIERLVDARLAINAEIKTRRAQLKMLERAHSIVDEDIDDTPDPEPEDAPEETPDEDRRTPLFDDEFGAIIEDES